MLIDVLAIGSPSNFTSSKRTCIVGYAYTHRFSLGSYLFGNIVCGRKNKRIRARQIALHQFKMHIVHLDEFAYL